MLPTNISRRVSSALVYTKAEEKEIKKKKRPQSVLAASSIDSWTYQSSGLVAEASSSRALEAFNMAFVPFSGKSSMLKPVGPMSVN